MTIPITAQILLGELMRESLRRSEGLSAAVTIDAAFRERCQEKRISLEAMARLGIKHRTFEPLADDVEGVLH